MIPKESETPPLLPAGLGRSPELVLAGFDYIAVYDSEEEVRSLAPDFARLEKLDLRGVVATAPGAEFDFVSRCFFPKLRVNEDPVTGSAHCELAPYWGSRLGRTKLTARQLSKRGGIVRCEVKGERVALSGTAVDFLVGEMSI